MSLPADHSARAEALDHLRSFCVSAPAGSGKTELLIQRFLRLLPRVEQPEQVLAITFTRKAAAEMRQRVAAALAAAADEDTPVSSEHEKLTRNLAMQALQHSKTLSWSIERDLNRLNIKTIDSLCAGLTRSMPISSQLGGAASPVDDASELYAEAVVDLFAELDAGSSNPPLEALLSHFDNRWSQVQSLLGKLLAQRAQIAELLWLGDTPELAEAQLRASVEATVGDELRGLGQLLQPFAGQLLTMQQHAAAELETLGPAWTKFPDTTAQSLLQWRQLVQLIAVKDLNGLRKTVTVRSGFPSTTVEQKAVKASMLALLQELAELAEREPLLPRLRDVAALPDIQQPSESFQLLLDISALLPQLAARLLLVFSRRGLLDHSQIALSALQSLGPDEAPTPLAQRLDYQISHLLVDEFQDTSNNQYELIRKLTRGWAEHNEAHQEAPRTVMLVGDAMQSIYGFRDANVGLFIRASSQGLNGLALQPLQLTANFRSQQHLVDWINTTFGQAFPQQLELAQNRVPYTPAEPVIAPGCVPAVTLREFSGEAARQAEAEWLAQAVQQAVADDTMQSVAILGRSRNQLQQPLAALKRAGIAYTGQDLDSLADSAVIMDLMTLCRVLSSPVDAVAWMAVLRAPWCGLTLADMLSVAQSCGGYPAGLAWREMAQGNATPLPGLSEDGAARLQHVAIALQRALNKRDRLDLRVWVERLWLELGGAATCRDENQLRDAERFFQLLEEAQREGVGLHLQWLQRRVERLYASAEAPDSKVQVMTLHRAKGLEFDQVFIPALGSGTGGGQQELLLWDEHIDSEGQRRLLLAAADMPGKKNADPSLFTYLEWVAKRRQQDEATRLMYVGATRAARKLVLTANLASATDPENASGPSKGTLLGTIWESWRDQAERSAVQSSDNDSGQAVAPALYRLRKLPGPGALPAATAATAPAAATWPPSDNRRQRLLGTVVHAALEALSRRRPLPARCDPSDHAIWRCLLLQDGLTGADLDTALAAVLRSVDQTLNDSRGRWILDSGHAEAGSELALTLIEDGGTRDIVIDRVFVDTASATRWVVDYKNSEPEAGEDPAEFMSRELAQYREQLLRYRHAASQLGPQAVQCALYFPAFAGWCPLPD